MNKYSKLMKILGLSEQEPREFSENRVPGRYARGNSPEIADLYMKQQIYDTLNSAEAQRDYESNEDLNSDSKKEMTPQRIEALTGTEHPKLKENRRMKMLIDSKIAQIEESDDPIALESLNFWKQKRNELDAE